MNTEHVRGVLEWLLMVALVLGCGAVAVAQQDQASSEVVKIVAPDGDAGPQIQIVTTPKPKPMAGDEAPTPSPYWIGLMGGEISPELRAQLDIPENQGVVVRDVVPDSPAAKAGLKQYDVLLRANDDDLGDMSQLVDLVKTAGDQQGQFSLEVLRKGKRESVWISPAERPERPQPHGGFFGGPNARGGAQAFFGRFGENQPFEFRSFGPAVIVVRGKTLSQLPGGVTVSIKKQGDEAVHITITRGDETWDITGDDPESLAKLPDDIRPVIEQLVRAGGSPEIVLPKIPNIPQPMPVPQFDDERFQKRMEQMEKQLEKLQERLQDSLQQKQQALEKMEEQIQKQVEKLQDQLEQESQQQTDQAEPQPPGDEI